MFFGAIFTRWRKYSIQIDDVNESPWYYNLEIHEQLLRDKELQALKSNVQLQPFHNGHTLKPSHLHHPQIKECDEKAPQHQLQLLKYL